MKNIISKALIVIGLTMTGCVATQVAPDMGKISADAVLRTEIITHGKSFSFSGEKDRQATCSAAEDMLCLVKNRQLVCLKWVSSVYFVFIPRDDELQTSFRAIGYSSDEKKFPTKKYDLTLCK